VAALRHGPLVVLFDDNGGDQPPDGGVVGEHAHDVGCASASTDVVYEG
jgi:hypothetical protein